MANEVLELEHSFYKIKSQFIGKIILQHILGKNYGSFLSLLLWMTRLGSRW